MPPKWTTAQIIALAPDDASKKAGKDLAIPRKWVTLGCNEQIVWGECQGSGSKPYQTQIDLREPAFKCSCPSRKLPCKHSLGLFLLLADRPADFTQNAPPEWVEKWLKNRAGSAEKKAKKQQGDTLEIDPATPKRAAEKAKRAGDRTAKVTAGMQELELWMRDLVRQGLASAQGKDYSFWDAPAARLMDAQARSLANQLREMASIPYSGTGWPERLLEQLGRLYLLVEGYKRLDTLPEGTQGDIRTMIGWTQSTKELLQREGVRDRWLILGQRAEEVTGETDLRLQRTWLWGRDSGKAAMNLEFAYRNRSFESNFVTGTCIDAELVFYPSAYPMRSQIKTRHAATVAVNAIPGYETIVSALKAYSDALSRNPWLELFPMPLSAAIPIRYQDGWAMRDIAGNLLPVAQRFKEGWQLLAISGGRAIAVFGEWNGDRFLPLSAWAAGTFIRF